MSVEQKKSKLIEDLIFQNGDLNGRIRTKNILIADRIRELYEIKSGMCCITDRDRVQEEIDWLKELANI